MDMREIRQTDEFRSWLKGLRDTRAGGKIAARIDRLAIVNAGDIASVGEGVSELRIHLWPGVSGLLSAAWRNLVHPTVRR